jgi:hypothetical protein
MLISPYELRKDKLFALRRETMDEVEYLRDTIIPAAQSGCIFSAYPVEAVPSLQAKLDDDIQLLEFIEVELHRRCKEPWPEEDPTEAPSE